MRFPSFEKEKQLIVNIVHLQRTELQNHQLLSLLHEELDWRYILSVTEWNHVMNPLYLTLTQSLFSSIIPPAIQTKLHQRFSSSLSQTMLLSEELKNLVTLFAGNKIAMILLKGPIIAQLVYIQPALREYADLDILIRFEQLALVKELLQNNGYQLYEGIYLEPFYLKYHHHLIFFKRKGNMPVAVEIHWHIIPSVAPIKLDVESLWSSSVEVSLADCLVRRLSWENMLFQLSTSLILDEHISLRLFCDITQLIHRYGSELDWQALIESARRAQGLNVLYNALWYSRAYLNVALPEQILNTIQINHQQCLGPHLEESIFTLNRDAQGRWFRSKSYHAFWGRYLVLADTWPTRFRYLRSLMFPNEYFLRSFYGVRHPSVTLFNRIFYVLKGLINIVVLLILLIRLPRRNSTTPARGVEESRS